MSRLHSFLVFFVLLTSLFIWQQNVSADCSCNYSGWVIGVEFIAHSCPPEGPPDLNAVHTYRIFNVTCFGYIAYDPRWGSYYDQQWTANGISNTYVNSGYRVLRNPSGSHLLAVHNNYQGKVAGMNMAGLPAGVYETDSLNEYCQDVPDVQDSDGDGFPTCFDCNDNDLNFTNNCPTLQKDKNLGRQCKANTLFGNPINAATGNKYHDEEDFKLTGPSADSSLSLHRYYNSQSKEIGPFGYGWSFSYGLSLEFTGDSIIAWRADGKAVYFDAASLEAESGAREQLLDNGDGTYTLVRVNGTEETYNSSGQLVSISDRNNNTLALSYQAGELVAVSDDFGHSIAFSYNGAGYIDTALVNGNLAYQYQYDGDSNHTGITYPDNTSKQYLYEDANDLHNLTGIIDERNIRIGTYGYDGDDRAILSRGPDDSKRIDVVYEAGSDLDATQVINSKGDVTTLQRDVIQGVALAASISGPGCSSCANGNKVYSWDEQTLQMLAETDGEDNTTTYSYDSRGNVLTRTEGAGTLEERTVSYTYHPNFNLVTEISRESVDSPGNPATTVMTYDSHGNLIQKDVNGYVNGVLQTISISFGYNSHGQPITIDGPRTDVNDVVTFDYFANDSAQGLNRGQLMKTTDALGHETAYSQYNDFGKPQRIVNPNAVITDLNYGDRGFLSSETTAGLTTTYLRDNAGNVTQVDPPGPGTVSYSYDNPGRLTQIEDSLGNFISYTYDTEGKKTREEMRDPGGILRKATDYQYDAYNRLQKIIRPDSLFQEFHYDNAGNRIQQIDEAGSTTDFGFDSLNRLTTINEPGSTVTTFSYDSHDNLVSVVNPEGLATSFLFDDFGRNLLLTSPDSGAITYSYDAAGNLISTTDANGITITYDYDSLNRLTSIQYPQSGQTMFSYDEGQYGKGRLTGMTDAQSRVSFQYDALGRLIIEQSEIEGKIYKTEYSYDGSGMLTQMTYPGGRKVTYERDQAGNITAVKAAINGVERTLAGQIGYQPFGPADSALLGNGLAASRTYNQSYELTAMQDGDKTNRSLSYQPGTLIDDITDNLDAGRNQSFDYDALKRLSSAQGIYGTTGYTYDKIGNRQTAVMNGDTYGYTYQTASSILQDITGPEQTTFSHDAHGNITARNNLSFVYNDNNRLQEAWLGGVLQASYFYNGFGQRIKKVSGGETIVFHYDPAGNLISEDNLTTSQQKDYIYRDSTPLAMVTSDYSQTDAFDNDRDGDIDGRDLVTALFSSAPNLSLLAAGFGKTDCTLPTESVFYYHTDHLGTPLLLTDDSATVVWQADYEPFGNA
ncbi:MAG: RHS domain-containing protein, partial [Desulfobulbaceae bacterium]|nr:RHS domain-containing protein [Desulfobulbaceae bacterium]